MRTSTEPCGSMDGEGRANPTNSVRSVGNTGTTVLHPRELPAWGEIEGGCLPAVRCPSMEPADTNNPITTHTPARSQPQHRQTNHTSQASRRASIWKHRGEPHLLR